MHKLPVQGALLQLEYLANQGLPVPLTRRLSEAKGARIDMGTTYNMAFIVHFSRMYIVTLRNPLSPALIFDMNAVDVCLVALSVTNVTMCFKERLILMIHALSIRTLRTSPLTENLMRLFDDCTEKLLCIVISYAACSNARYLESANLTPGSIGM